MNTIKCREMLREPLRQATLCFLIRDNEVLLAIKKRGFVKGRWNGVDGKPNPGESVDQAAVRETEEMMPSWYKKDALPLGEMWPDDKYWLPLVLSGSKIKAEFLFGENDTALDFNVSEVETLTWVNN